MYEGAKTRRPCSCANYTTHGIVDIQHWRQHESLRRDQIQSGSLFFRSMLSLRARERWLVRRPCGHGRRVRLFGRPVRDIIGVSDGGPGYDTSMRSSSGSNLRPTPDDESFARRRLCSECHHYSFGPEGWSCPRSTQPRHSPPAPNSPSFGIRVRPPYAHPRLNPGSPLVG